MRRVLQNTKRTSKKLGKLPKMYLIAVWAGCGVLEFPFTGKFKVEGKGNNKEYIPLVYDYDDFNGTQDCFVLRKITDTTTGVIIGWSQYKELAMIIAQDHNKANNQD